MTVRQDLRGLVAATGAARSRPATGARVATVATVAWAVAAVIIASAGAALASPESTTDEAEALRVRLDQRARILDGQIVATEDLARARALALVRLERLSPPQPAGPPEDRADRARARGLGAMALHRDLAELDALAADRRIVDHETEALRRAQLEAQETPAPGPRPALSAPVSGPVVGAFGPGKEPATGVRFERGEIQLLARGGEIVRAPAAGVIRRVETGPGGIQTVVVTHAGRWTSVISGLRDVEVSVGAEVSARAALGIVARGADGAPVVGWALFRGRTAVAPPR